MKMTNQLRYLFCLTVVLFLTGSSALFSQELSRGIWYLHEEQNQTAKSYFVRAILKDPNSAKAYFYLGDVYDKLMHQDSSERAFNAGMERNPLEPLNYAGLGRISYYKGLNTQALEYFEKGRKLSKNDLNFLSEVVRIALSEKIKDFTTAQKYLAILESLDDKNPDYYLLKGDMKYLDLSLGEAVNEYQRAIFYNKSCIPAYIKLGKLFTKAKNYLEASNAFNIAIRLDSNQIAVYRYYGELNYDFGKYYEAKRYYEKYLSLADYCADVQEQYAYILFFSDEYEKANTIVDTLLKASPDSPVLHRLKAYMSYELGQYGRGLESIEMLYKLEPPDKLISSDYVYKGRLLIKNGQDSVGVRNLILAFQMDHSKTELIPEITQKLTQLKDHSEAIDWYMTGLQEGVDNERNTYYNIGKEFYMWALDTVQVTDSIEKVMLLQKADTSFTRVTEVSPNAFTGYLLRGRVRSQLDPDQMQGLAVSDYEKAMVLIREGDTVKNQKYLQECYKYLSYYYFTAGEKALHTNQDAAKASFRNALGYLQYILIADPDDPEVIATMDYLEAVLKEK